MRTKENRFIFFSSRCSLCFYNSGSIAFIRARQRRDYCKPCVTGAVKTSLFHRTDTDRETERQRVVVMMMVVVVGAWLSPPAAWTVTPPACQSSIFPAASSPRWLTALSWPLRYWTRPVAQLPTRSLSAACNASPHPLRHDVNYTWGDSDVISFLVYTSWFPPPCCG